MGRPYAVGQCGTDRVESGTGSTWQELANAALPHDMNLASLLWAKQHPTAKTNLRLNGKPLTQEDAIRMRKAQ